MLKENAIPTVLRPSTAMLTAATTRAPYRSASPPTTGCATPFTIHPTKATVERNETDTSYSSVHDGRNSPKLCRKPMETNTMKKTAATMYQP